MEGDLYKNKYRIKSCRYDGWDYSNEGYYFITICTKDRELFFGDVIGGKMILNEFGKIIKDEWLNTEKIRKNIKLDEYVIMPNHVHGIIIIKYKYRRDALNASKTNPAMQTETHAMRRRMAMRLYDDEGEYKNKFGPQSNNLSAILRGFKGATKKIIRQRFPEINFSWQEKFYDRIIRNEDELNRIRQYIIDNPYKCLPAIAYACPLGLPARLASRFEAGGRPSEVGRGIRRWQAGGLDRHNPKNF